MIVNLKNKHSNLLKYISFHIKSVFLHFTFFQKANKLVTDSKYLDKYFLHKYPTLKTDFSGQIICVSCGECEKICPTDSISIEKSGLMSLPQTHTTGEVPSHFILDTHKCIKCHLCADVCVVNAIKLSENYRTDSHKVDLISLANKEFMERKVDNELEAED